MHIVKLPSGKYINIANISTVDKMTKTVHEDSTSNHAVAFLRVHWPSDTPAEYFGLYFEDLYDEDMYALLDELDEIAAMCSTRLISAA